MTAWSDCRRCERHVQRLVPLHPLWATGTLVALIGSNASRSAQAAQIPDPVLCDAARELAQRLRLPAASVSVDYLVACGTGARLSADYVAACSERFCEQTAVPKVVVLFGAPARELAESAGLVVGGSWEPVNSPWKADVVFANSVDEQVVQEVARRLGVQPAVPKLPSRVGAGAAARDLLDLLGDHAGHRRKGIAKAEWSTRKTHRLTVSSVQRHLEGACFVSPFHPRGPWPFVVIDIDRHNALQAKSFDDTIARICADFPNGIALQSSKSGGVHVYVRLPDETTYEEAALVLRVFLAQKDLLWYQPDHHPVRTMVAEVPLDPPRLPFGEGSNFVGDTRPVADQVAEFLHRLSIAHAKDFDCARTKVRASLRLNGPWTVATVRRVSDELERMEVRKLPVPVFDPNDPLSVVATRLPRHLQKVLAHGVPAYGTRTRWVRALAKAFGEHLSPAATAMAIEDWLRSCPPVASAQVDLNKGTTRRHLSSDLEEDPERIIAEAKQYADDCAKTSGVPTRIWQRVEQLIRATYLQMSSPVSLAAMEARRGRRFSRAHGHLTLDDLLKTAFHILTLFYKGAAQYRRPVRRRSIGYREFGKYVGRNLAHDVEMALTNLDSAGRGWLTCIQGASPRRAVRKYRLTDTAWPVRPHEPKSHQP